MSEPEPRRVRRTEEAVAADLPALVDVVADGSIRVVIAREGRPVAALISAHDLVRLQNLEAERAALFQPVRETWALFADLPADEVEREVANAIAEVRAEARAAARANGHAS